MRLVAQARKQVETINRVRHRIGGRVGRERLARGVQISRLRHLRHGQRHQLIRALEIMVLERRFVDLGEEFGFVLAVGKRRVEVPGPFLEGAVKDILVRVGGGIRIVPGDIVATAQQQCQQAEKQRPDASGKTERGEH